MAPDVRQHSQFDLLRQRRFAPFFLTQALGAFNDNVYRQAIIGLLFWLGASDEQKTLYGTLAPALFILPYFLFSSIAGQVAEKLEKSRVIRITTAMEIAIMSLAAVGFALQSLPVLLIALFCTGVQSTLFGPVKYSILPSVLKPEELTGGNGLVEMGTSVSILLGMLLGGSIFHLAGQYGPYAAGGTVIALAVAGNLVSRLIPPAGASAPELRVRWNPLPESLALLPLTRRQLAVRNAVLGVSWFWYVGTVLTSVLPAYAETVLGGGATLYLFALALFSIGTGIGSMLCEKLSARTVEIGLVPVGALGITAFLVHLYFGRPGAAAARGLDVAGFLAAPGGWRVAHGGGPGRDRVVHRLVRGAAVRADPVAHAEVGDVAGVRRAEHPELRLHRAGIAVGAGGAALAGLDDPAGLPRAGGGERTGGGVDLHDRARVPDAVPELGAGALAVPAAHARHRPHSGRRPGAGGVQPRQLHGRADPVGGDPAAGALGDVPPHLRDSRTQLDLPHR
jgi:MFS family permease